MGMAASQARFLGLTARKSNVEYQVQQINQQRTSLANESAGLYNQMMELDVPTPPSTNDYYQTTYVLEGTGNDYDEGAYRIENINKTYGKALNDAEIANVIKNTAKEMGKLFPKTDKEIFKKVIFTVN